jgi:hypothetical protein
MKPWALARAMREAEAMALDIVFCMVKDGVLFVRFVGVFAIRSTCAREFESKCKNECGCSRSDRDLFELSLLEVWREGHDRAREDAKPQIPRSESHLLSTLRLGKLFQPP